VKPFRTLAWTVAFYNTSWGTGYSLGPVVRGWLGGLPSWQLATLMCVPAVAHTALVLVARTAPRRAREEVHPTAVFASTPSMRWMGWIAAGAGCTLAAGLGGALWPSLGVARGLGVGRIALGLIAMSVPIPVLSLVWPPMRRALAKPWLMLGLLAVGGLAFGLLPWTCGWGSLACLAGVGLMVSGTCFCGIYYSNADPRSATRSVGVYEAIMGISGILGPLGLGTLAWKDASAPRTYLAGAGLIALAALAIFYLHVRENKSSPLCPRGRAQ
jgi:hypothetical protein